MTKYHLNLAHLYGDLLNTYSDVGNIIALRYYAKQMDADIAVKVVSIDEEFNPDEFDMALFGGGQDYEQLVVSKDLPNKKAGIRTITVSLGTLPLKMKKPGRNTMALKITMARLI